MNDNQYMRRALELAELGRGAVSPNPMVGCVIVHEDKIIGEGYHQKYGEAHAEVNAINSVMHPELLRESTVYVTLEPCAHHGKTPPCADLLVEKSVKKVVIATRDPFDQVDGKGIEKLTAAGIEVSVGILEKESISLNQRFLNFHQKKRPYILLKWAQTADGFVARENYDSKWISNASSRQLVHKWRAEEDAILVGKNTAIHDDPSLTTRDWEGANPIRIVLDKNLEVPESHKLFNEEAPTLIFNQKKTDTKNTNEWIQLDELHPGAILKVLYEKGIQSVIIEGGTSVLNSFIKNNCWDEARVFTSKAFFESGIEAPLIGDAYTTRSEKIDDDLLTYYLNEHG